MLSLCLTACATPLTPPTVVEYKTVREVPPADMVSPCDTYNAPVFDVGDTVDALTDTREQRDICAAKIDALREWSNRVN